MSEGIFADIEAYLVSFYSLACLSGFYGPDCALTCGNCAGGEPCNTVDGTCQGGCEPGWTGGICSDGNIDMSHLYNVINIELKILKTVHRHIPTERLKKRRVINIKLRKTIF